MNVNDRITEYFEAHREEMLIRLSALCAIPSVEGPAEEGKPFGKEVDRALSLAESMFREEGFDTERAPNGHYVLASCGEGPRTIGIFAHADVVPQGEDWKVTRPFVAKRHEGLIVARGAEDNKGGIIAALYLLKAVRELALPLSARLLVFVGGNEETGMRDVAAFRREQKMPDVSLVPDNNPPVSLGEKGRTTGWLSSPPVLSEVLDFTGGTAYNVVLDRATVTLAYSEALYASLRGLIEGEEALSLSRDERTGNILLHACGRSAHACNPVNSVNAAALAASLLASCELLSADERGAMASAAIFLSDPYGGTLGLAGEDGPFGKRTAVSGMVRVRNSRLFLSQDIRYGSATSWAELGPVLDELLEEEEWEFLLDSANDGFDVGDDDPLANALLAAYHRVTGNLSAKPYRSGGGTYARLLPRGYSMGLVVPGVGPSPYEVLGEGRGDPHRPDECLPVDSFLAALRVLVEYTLTAADFLSNE